MQTRLHRSVQSNWCTSSNKKCPDINLDFEAAMWQAVAEVIQQLFHLDISSISLRLYGVKYNSLVCKEHIHVMKKTHGYIHQLLPLPYLPCEHIGPILERLREKAVTQLLQEVTTYIAITRLENPLWLSSSTYSYTFYMRRPNGLIFRCIWYWKTS